MKYTGEPDYRHGSPMRLGVMLVNLGTPDDTSTPAVRRYLRQFLSDPRVVEVPRLIWWAVLHGVILRFRPSRTAAAYQSVWHETDGSPLLSIGLKQAQAVQQSIDSQFPITRPIVALAMRYGNPSIAATLAQFRADGVRRLLVLPLYPQYSGSTVASVFDEVTRQLSHTRWIPETRFINQYFDAPPYIAALAKSVQKHWQEHGRNEHLVMSFHGIPQRYRDAGDPYFCQCHATARLLAEALQLAPTQYRVVFQSRFGREPWLQPYCDETLKRLPTEGIRSIDVICPGFSADCLETIEEIDEENREYFLHAGGERFSYISALNDDAEHISCLLSLITQHISGWPEATDLCAQTPEHRDASRERALALGAAS